MFDRRTTWRRGAVLLVAVTAMLAIGVGAAWAEGDLRIEAEAAYELLPEGERLTVSVHFTLTNQKRNTSNGSVITRYYFDRYPMLMPDAAVNIRAVDGDGHELKIEDEITEIDDEGTEARVVTVLFYNPSGHASAVPGRLFYGASTEFTLTFDLAGGEPRSDSDVRVNPAYAAFTVWAWGDPGLSDVAIALPDDFDVQYAGSALVTRTADGRTTWFRNDIPDPDQWAVFFTGRRDAALDTQVVTVGDLAVGVKAWPGDRTWGDRVRDVVERGLPALQDLVGLGFGEQTGLDILEALDPSLVGYAGWYLLDEDVIEMGEYLDDHVVIHEISHLWFNEDLFTERWITEGLADDFADQIVDALELESDPAYGTYRRPITTRSVAVPLNDWRFPYTAPAGDEEVASREEYGYNASFFVIRVLRDEIGKDALIEVLRAADGDLIAYRAGEEVETVAPEDDWRRFLDLLVEVGGSEKAEQVFTDYVLDEEQIALLAERTTAREAYAALLEHDAGWETPITVRRPLSDWDFATAGERITAAEVVLDLRDDIAAAADAFDLQPPVSLETAYESASSLAGLTSAALLGERQLEGITAVADARTVVDADRDFFTRIGLWGEDPEAEWQQAADAFVAADQPGTLAEAADVVDLLEHARHVGTVRVIWAAAGAVLLLLLIGASLWLLVRRRRHIRNAEGTPDSVSSDTPGTATGDTPGSIEGDEL